MKRVLLVDDEQPFLKSMSDGLAAFSSLEVRTANTGREATNVLRSIPIDVVVTDIQMPEMGGLELLAYVTRHHPTLPVIVMTAFATPTTKEQVQRLGAIECFDKPIDFDRLTERIFAVLLDQQRSVVRSISVASFLQLAKMERISCRLWVTRADEVGSLVLSKGRLIHAALGGKVGNDAAYTIIGWEQAVIDIEWAQVEDDCEITNDLEFIVMEAIRRADESKLSRRQVGSCTEGALAKSRSWRPSETLDLGERAVELPRVTDAENLAYKCCLENLRCVKGHRATTIVSADGTPIAFDSCDPSIDLLSANEICHEFFNTIHHTSNGSGLQGTREALFGNPKGIIIMRCSDVGAKVHLHVITVLTPDGNQTLIRHYLDQLVRTLEVQ